MKNRDYNSEAVDNQRKYAYRFDFDVMHPYMIRSFRDWFVHGNALELGCFKGDFTQRLCDYFDDITCVEASSEAIQTASSIPKLSNVCFVKSLFEKAELPKKYNNIILTHVLEHLEDRVGLLQMVREKWLEEEGSFIIACPNAHAPSRQIAVKMGLIERSEAVTPAEHDHGHRVTYTLKTLGEDIDKAGLKVKHSSGIFFKAMANFQWDQLIGGPVISPEYLDGCYELGKEYPDLCSSIYYVCTK